MLNGPDVLPPCLEALSNDKREMVNDTLCNDDVSSDEEMVDYWRENGLTQEEAEAAIAYRPEALRDPFFQLFPTSTMAP